MCSAFSNLSLGALERSSDSSFSTRMRVEASLSTEAAEVSMKSPPFMMLNMMDGIDR